MFNLQITNKAEKLILVAFIVLLALSISDQSVAQAASLKQCQKWNDKVEHYQEKRKKGGSGEQMDKWHRKIRQHKEKFRKNKCNKYGKRNY